MRIALLPPTGLWLAALTLFSAHFAAAQDAAGEDSPQPVARPVLVAVLDDETISPGTARYLDRVIREAAAREAACVVVQLDTPGGLLDSTRYIVKRFLGSEVPIVVYVAPSGSRAASAGVFVTMSAHVAAMAPGTTIGAAHPVQIGTLPIEPRSPLPGEAPEGTGGRDDAPSQSADGVRSPMEEKIINDTVSWARALAERRGRNADWAAEAVRKSVSISAAEAKEQDVIDVIAEDLGQLLADIDGREVVLPSGAVALRTADAPVERAPMWWGEQVLTIIGHPNVAFLLLMFGFYGILFEMYSPGWGVPGTLGLVCMLLGLAGLAVLPVNYLGFGLLLVALALFAAEAFVASYGALAAAGTACLLLGGIMLVDSPAGFTRVSWSVVLPVAAATATIVLLLIGGVLRTHGSPVKTGSEALIGADARTSDAFTVQDDRFRGTVKLHGERWRAVCEKPLEAGQPCRVVGRDGLTLEVSPREEAPPP